MSVDYLLHESSVGYAIFQVVHQPDTVANRLKEVQESVQVICVDREEVATEEILTFLQDLAKFGKMVKLVSFAPFQYDKPSLHGQRLADRISEEQLKRSKMRTRYRRAWLRNT